jgi:Protein of unknown function (DUF2924)
MKLKQNEHGGLELNVSIGSILAMSTDQLSRAWHKKVSKVPPHKLPKSLFARVLAYRLQADLFGDLGKEAVRLLDTIVNDLAVGKTLEIKPPTGRRLKSGSVLVREHNGVLQRVMVLEEGYAWQGKTFSSLSSAAKAITGTNWNGQRFFGLKEKVRSKSEATI